MQRPLFLLFALNASAHAGMPSYSFSDVARLRVEDLSFFLLVLLLAGFGVKLLWNLFAKDFPKLPRLNYRRALALTTLLGLFTVLVLSMISGARELLTPGAWRKQGATYRLNDTASEPIRRKSLAALRAGLWDYAKSHDGRFPKDDFAPEIPDELWTAPGESAYRYVYFGGHIIDAPRAVVAAEPQIFGEPRMVLFATGEIQKMTTEEIERHLEGSP